MTPRSTNSSTPARTRRSGERARFLPRVSAVCQRWARGEQLMTAESIVVILARRSVVICRHSDSVSFI